jgi:hypothetical protein
LCFLPTFSAALPAAISVTISSVWQIRCPFFKPFGNALANYSLNSRPMRMQRNRSSSFNIMNFFLYHIRTPTSSQTITTMFALSPLHPPSVVVDLIPISLSPFSSCGQNADAAFDSFGWSDMPYQGDYVMDDESLMCFGSSLSTGPAFSSTSTPVLFMNQCLPAAPSPTSSIQLDLFALSTKNFKRARTSFPKRQRMISFADALEVRTYEVVLGDHPCCRGGMALECGWKHCESEMVDLELHEQHSQRRRMMDLHLSFHQRRQRLQDITGMTGAELLKVEYALCCEPQSPDDASSSPGGSPASRVLHRAASMKVYV